MHGRSILSQRVTKKSHAGMKWSTENELFGQEPKVVNKSGHAFKNILEKLLIREELRKI
tara:strand:+ start:238 stop:414 length:177 start_codon:yes stop_codon:yes gene_type:complete